MSVRPEARAGGITIDVLSQEREYHCAIAGAMGCMEGTVRFHLHRSIQQA